MVCAKLCCTNFLNLYQSCRNPKSRWYLWHRHALRQRWMRSVEHTVYLSQELGLAPAASSGAPGRLWWEQDPAAAPCAEHLPVASQRWAPSLPRTRGPLQTRLKGERLAVSWQHLCIFERAWMQRRRAQFVLCAWPLSAKFRAVWAIKCDRLLASSPGLLAGISSKPSWDQLNWITVLAITSSYLILQKLLSVQM